MESTPVPHLEITFRRGAHASSTRAVYWSSPQIAPSNLPAYLSRSASSRRSCTCGTISSISLLSSSGLNLSSTGIMYGAENSTVGIRDQFSILRLEFAWRRYSFYHFGAPAPIGSLTGARQLPSSDLVQPR